MAPTLYWAFVLAYTLGTTSGSPLNAQLAQLIGHLDNNPPQELFAVDSYLDESEIKIRTKRQLNNNYGSDPGSQVITDIFQIPIQTLTAISNLFRSTRVQRTNKKRLANQQQASTAYTAYSAPNTYYTTDSNGVNNNHLRPATTHTANSAPSAYYTTDSNGVNNGYSDAYSRPNRYTSSNGYNRPNNYYSQYSNGVRGSRATAASIAHLSVAADGSSFKI